MVVLLGFYIASTAAAYAIPLTPGRGGGQKSSTVGCTASQLSLSLCSQTDSGYASLNRDGKLLLISNLKDGIDEYQFPSMEKVQTFTHPIDTNCVLQTRAVSSRNLIVAGGDDGFARVFNRISGQLVSEIRHGCKCISSDWPMGILMTSSSSWSAHTSC